MQYLFKIAPGAVAGKEKISDTDFALHYPGVNRNMMWSEILPYIRQATTLSILPYIGDTLYNDLATKIQANTALTPEQTAVATSLKDVIAYYTIVTALPKKKTILSSMGAVENNADGGSTQSTLWGYKATLWSVSQDADRLFDNLLQLLEKYSKQGIAYFIGNWKDKEEYEAHKSDFFLTTADFQYRHPINNSRRTFVAMLPIMREMADEKIRPILCDSLFEQLKTQIRANNLSPNNIILLNYVQKALAKWTVAAAADALTILPEQDGFRIYSSADGIDTRTYATETIRGALIGIKEQAENSARTATADLVNILYRNPDDYPLWRDSPCNRSGETTDRVCADGAGAVML